MLGSDDGLESLQLRVEVFASLSPVFRAMMESPMAEARERVVRLPDADARAFEILLSNKTRNTKESLTPLNSVNTALGLLSFCRKYLISDTKSEATAIKYLQKNIQSDNVLFILHHLKLLNQTLPFHDSLGPLMNFLIKVSILTERCTNGFDYPQDCLSVIDKHAVSVLRSETFEDLSLDLVRDLVSRDSLDLSGTSETEIYFALDRWSHRQCRRRGLRPHNSNKRSVLAGCQYLVRYPTMTPGQLALCLARSSLITNKEVELVTRSLLHYNFNLRNQELNIMTSISYIFLKGGQYIAMQWH